MLIRSLLPVALTALALFSLSLPAQAGKYECLQTLISIDAKDTASWQRGLLPAVLRADYAKPYSTVFQDSKGQLYILERGEIYQVPYQKDWAADDKLLVQDTSSEAFFEKLVTSKSVRYVSPGGNSFHLHVFEVGGKTSYFARTEGDDPARMNKSRDRVESTLSASRQLLEKNKLEYQRICDEMNTPLKDGHFGRFVMSFQESVGARKSKTQLEKEAEWKKDDIKFAENRAALNTAQLEQYDRWMFELQESRKARTDQPITLARPIENTQQVDVLYNEISAGFKKAGHALAPTDRAEIEKSCGGLIELPKAVAEQKKPSFKENFRKGMSSEAQALFDMMVGDKAAASEKTDPPAK